MQTEWDPRAAAPTGGKRVDGLVYGLVVAIPLSLLLGAVAILALQSTPVSAIQGVMFAIAAVCEYLLLRHAVRTIGAKTVAATVLAQVRRVVRYRGSSRALAKRAIAMSALAATYLHYYFWDVQLQIASLRRVIVFVPVYATG